MTKKIAFLLCLIFFVSLVNTAHAHIVSSKGSIGTNIHIDPDDKPYAGQQTSISIQFKDTTEEFDSTNCICTIVVKQDKNIILTKKLFENNTDRSIHTTHVPILFPIQGIYQISISGTPRESAHFEQFSITYEINVDRDVYSSPKKTSISNTKKIIFVASTIGVLLAGSVFVTNKRKKQKLKPNKYGKDIL